MSFTVKKEVDINDLMITSPKLLLLFANVCLYAEKNGLPVKVTSLREHVDGRVSTTHIDGRAFDMSLAQWPERNIKEMTRRFNERFKHIGAISRSDYKPRAVVIHDIGKGIHAHCQVKK